MTIIRVFYYSIKLLMIWCGRVNRVETNYVFLRMSYISEKNSYHPFSLVKSILKLQFIRIRRICTSLNNYWYNAK